MTRLQHSDRTVQHLRNQAYSMAHYDTMTIDQLATTTEEHRRYVEHQYACRAVGIDCLPLSVWLADYRRCLMRRELYAKTLKRADL